MTITCDVCERAIPTHKAYSCNWSGAVSCRKCLRSPKHNHYAEFMTDAERRDDRAAKAASNEPNVDTLIFAAQLRSLAGARCEKGGRVMQQDADLKRADNEGACADGGGLAPASELPVELPGSTDSRAPSVDRRKVGGMAPEGGSRCLTFTTPSATVRPAITTSRRSFWTAASSATRSAAPTAPSTGRAVTRSARAAVRRINTSQTLRRPLLMHGCGRHMREAPVRNARGGTSSPLRTRQAGENGQLPRNQTEAKRDEST